MNYTTAHFVSTKFDELYILVSLPLAAVIILLNVAASVIIMVINLLNTLYSHTKSIKASSVRLNNFAYAGCYLVNVATVFYTILEAFGVSIKVKTLVKTARLYYVFNAKYKRTSKHLNDTTLGAVVVVLTSLSAVFCVVWLGSDHYIRLVNKTLEQLGDNLITVMRESCHCRHDVIWILIVAIWECVLLAACVFFGFFSGKVITMKRFQPHGIIILAYLLSITSGIGGITYFITSITRSNLNVRYGMISLMLTVGVYLCIVLLFFPPIRPVVKEISRRVHVQ